MVIANRLLTISDVILMKSVLQEANKVFEEKFKTGKSRWFFTKLRF